MSKRLIGRTLVLVLALGLTYGGLNLAGAAVPSGVLSVFVNNTATNPVPVNVSNESVHVNGTVSVANTPTVKVDPTGNTVTVGNTPNVKLDPTGNTVQIAPGQSVSVSGTPTVSVSGTASVQVAPTDIVKAAAYVDAQAPYNSDNKDLYTVPAGKRLIVTYVSALGTTTTGTNEELTLYEIFNGTGGPIAAVPLHFVGTFTSSGGDNYQASEQTWFVVDSGDTLSASLAHSTNTGFAASNVNVYGYLVNAT